MSPERLSPRFDLKSSPSGGKAQNMRMRRLIAPVIGLATLGLATLSLTVAGWSQTGKTAKDKTAQPQKETPKADKTAKKEGATVWDLTWEQANYNDATGENEFSKIVAVSDEGTTIHADKWAGNNKAKTGRATGNLKMNDERADATGEKVDVFYGKGKRLLVLTGSVEILVKPKKGEAAAPPPTGPAPVQLQNGKATVKTAANEDNSSEGARKYPATIYCDKAEYEYARALKHATLTGNFKVIQKLSTKTRTLTAKYAEWFGNEERILLHGPVHMEESDGTVFDTKEDVPVSVKEGDERVEFKKGVGKIQLKDDDEEGPPKR